MNKITVKDNLPQGEYILKVKIKAKSDTKVSLFTNHRRFLLRNAAMKCGEEALYSFAVALRYAKFQKKDDYRDSKIELVYFGDAAIDAEVTAEKTPVLYLLGDSTVCDQTVYDGSDTEHCCGWGQTLSMFLKDNVAISNHAEQGTNTRDCLNCHFPPVLDCISQGDIVSMQFGHNDQKIKELTPKAYGENLVKIARAAVSRGASVIICTPINRLIFVNGVLNEYLASYSAAAKAAAAECGAKLVDLHDFTSELYLKMGDEAENLFFHSPELDRTHPCDIGGSVIGEYFAQSAFKKEIQKG